MAAAVIEAEGLTRRFAGVTAVRDMDLHIGAGEAVALLGPNGAGKTTCLRLLATVLRPTAGTLRLFEQPVRDGGVQARRRIGLLSHQSFLYPDLTPVENLEFYGRMFGVPMCRDAVRQLLERVGVLGWAHRPVRTLSRGLEQRCAVARAVLHEPDLLLLDEPFTGLDTDATTMLTDLLRQACARGATLLLTTHDLTRGIELCTRAVILVGGSIRYDQLIEGFQSQDFAQRYHAIVRPPGG